MYFIFKYDLEVHYDYFLSVRGLCEKSHITEGKIIPFHLENLPGAKLQNVLMRLN